MLGKLADAGILGGYDLGRDFPELGPALLVCATEQRTPEDIAAYARELGVILAACGIGAAAPASAARAT